MVHCLSLVALHALWLLVGSGAGPPPEASGDGFYRPKLRVPPALEPALEHVSPGADAFPEEKQAEEIAGRLNELSRALRAAPGRAPELVTSWLDPAFEGGRLAPTHEVLARGGPPLEIWRAAPGPPAAPLPARAFAEDLRALIGDLAAVATAEFLITGIEAQPAEQPRILTEVRYDVVGTGSGFWRGQRVGRWSIEWRRANDAAWRVLRWTAADQVRSRARAPVFAEVTNAAIGENDSFRERLAFALDAWLATLDSVFMRDSMGHHGVSLGDADGDGLDDVYVAQPAGLPNLLFRNRGDGRFEDVTSRAGVDVQDETSQSLFADVDNDGDQDLVLVTTSGLLLFANDGSGRFVHVADAFRLSRPLQGTPMSIAMADYDADGFLDIYLCTYSYFIGAGEDKSAVPAPYYDARNGPPNVLFRNDGRGHFSDVTEEAGLDENNDRYSFAAAWADYDDDGWPDLLVANDFGRKNLYRNRGFSDGSVRFEDVAAAAGVEDHGAGMSATWLDYDNDGRLDMYLGNMWSAAGQRVTAQPGFMPDAPEQVRALYRRHARGNALFRNRGDGGFDDVTLSARAAMGRWAWSSDGLDFDSDGFEDLYVVNGMFTREGAEQDLDGFFWRQVAASSPLTRVTATPYDDAWRAINRLLARQSQANHQRNVFLRNDGNGGFDDVSGSLGLDLDQDGRAFAVLDYDRDGDPDLVLMAPRSAPQLRVFRNDFSDRGAAVALRLRGRNGNRDAVGARVTVVTDRVRRTKIVQAGSGFISQHSRELLFGLGASERILLLTVRWPGGGTQTFRDVPLGHRLVIEEGGQPQAEPFRSSAGPPAAPAPAPAAPPRPRWLYEPFAAPDFTLRDLEGRQHTLSQLRGQTVLVLFWSMGLPGSRAAVRELDRHHDALARAGVTVLAVALDANRNASQVRSAARGLQRVAVLLGNDTVGGTYTLLNRYLFVGKDDLPVPSAFLVDRQGDIVKAYRAELSAAQLLEDVSAIAGPAQDRLAQALPFAGTLYAKPAARNDLQYALELVEQGWETSALPAFERAARGEPSAFTFYSLGTLYLKGGRPDQARASFERALRIEPGFAEARNGLGALAAQSGNLAGAIAHFRAALATTPDYPDALNNLGYALLQTGRESEAHGLYLRALELQPDLPEAFNNLGIYFARQGRMAEAESHFERALAKRPGYGEAGNNLALILMTRDAGDAAVAVLERLLQANPEFETTYLTLSRIHLSAHRRRDATQVLERLLQRNPHHPLGLEILRELTRP